METSKAVLVVDDDAMVLESIDLHLSAVGDFHTIMALGSTSAAEALEHGRVDVIIADVILAGHITGIDLCRKAIERYPGVAVVVITADTEVQCAEIPECGVFLRKPFGGEQLLEAIADALRKVEKPAAPKDGQPGR